MLQTSATKSADKAIDDIYFLNIENAYTEALKQYKVVDDNGKERLQFCYYDGLLTDITLPNFIQIPADNFVEIFANNHLPIPKKIVTSQDNILEINDIPKDIGDEINQLRMERNVKSYYHRDTYFIDPLLALNVAKQQNRIYCGHPTIDGLQICYYRGDIPEHSFDNLIQVDLDQFLDFFTFSRLRLPENLEIPEELEAGLKASVKADIEHLVALVKQNRLDLALKLANKAKLLQAPVIPNQALRVFIPANRLTTVMQYCSRSVAKAFEQKGFEVLFHIEENDMMTFNLVEFFVRYIDFNPHITFNINHINNYFLNKDVINIIWWQDPMPSLIKQQAIDWRDNDFNFSISPIFDQHLEKCHATHIKRQQFVIDTDIFNTKEAICRKDKIVFIGSSYSSYVKFEDAEQFHVVNQLLALINSSSCFTTEVIHKIADQSSLNYDFIFWKILHFVIRDYSVKWLCENQSLPVEIYGRFWSADPIVNPYYKGELQHGNNVATIYKSAKYALVSHPFEINTQRLAEVAACGCIPIVYDCRVIAEKPHWDEHCLFFKNEQDLYKILATQAEPKQSPQLIAEEFTYSHAVDNFIKHSGIMNISNTNNAEPYEVDRL